VPISTATYFYTLIPFKHVENTWLTCNTTFFSGQYSAGADPGFAKGKVGPWRARGARAYKQGLGAQREPLVMSQGAKPRNYKLYFHTKGPKV